MGYLNKVLRSDVFIWLHTVQFRKNYFQNRTLIRNINDAPLWLTLPVHARLGMNIDEVTIADVKWRLRVSRTIEQCYCKTPYFDSCWPPIFTGINEASDHLEDVNYRTFRALLTLISGNSTRVVRAGEWPCSTEDPTDRLVELCAAAGARRYIAGKGGQNYLRVQSFERVGIEVVWQKFDPDHVVYPQRGTSFVSGLSAIDCLFNVGPERTRELALAAWKP